MQTPSAVDETKLLLRQLYTLGTCKPNKGSPWKVGLQNKISILASGIRLKQLTNQYRFGICLFHITGSLIQLK